MAGLRRTLAGPLNAADVAFLMCRPQTGTNGGRRRHHPRGTAAYQEAVDELRADAWTCVFDRAPESRSATGKRPVGSHR